MYIKKVSLLIVLALWATTSHAAQPSSEAMYQDARRHFYALFSSPKLLPDRDQWLRVVKKFKVIAKTRPKSSRGRDSVYTMGLLYKKMHKRFKIEDDGEEGVRYFRKIINSYPKSTLVDDSQRHIGDIMFQGKKIRKAVRAYRKASLRKKKVLHTQKKRTKKKTSAPKKAWREPLAKITEISRFSRKGYTRIILHLSGKTAHKTQRIGNPNRVFIDFLDTKIAPDVKRITRYSSGMAKAIRLAKNKSTVARAVIDIRGNNFYYSVTALQNPYRIIIDIGKKETGSLKTRNVDKEKNRNNKKNRRGVVSVARPSGKLRTIVIDPGHGGRDPGAIGSSGLMEKDITLSIAKELKKKLKAKGYDAILTRETDRFMELDERTVIANSLNADLFISIHLNASENKKARGIETYFLSPARSKDELETAARENMLSLKSSNEIENDLAYILTDLSNTRKINDSNKLAGSLQRSLVRKMRRDYSGVKDKGVRQAVFYVLWRATMPSALVEAGFITNSREEKRFKDKRYIKALAGAIAGGVVKYSKTHMVAEAK